MADSRGVAALVRTLPAHRHPPPGTARRLPAASARRHAASAPSSGTIGAVPEVLVVEDDGALRAAVARALRGSGLDVTTASDGTGALAAAGRGPGTRFGAVVLDIGLPDSDGRDVCQALRARGIDVPVLFLTARDQLHDLLSGYAAGGDEYLTKPFHVRELVVRLQALLRRGAARPLPRPPRLQLDPAAHALEGPGGRQPLTPTEFRLLATLVAAPGDVVRRRDLVRAGWPDGAMVAENTLDQYVARLRRKLAAGGDHGHTISTVVGVGYRFS
jgi:two-component system response regulator MprA